MKISDTDLQEFISIHQEEFGETLSLAEASEMAFCLINLYTQLIKAIPSQQWVDTLIPFVNCITYWNYLMIIGFNEVDRIAVTRIGKQIDLCHAD